MSINFTGDYKRKLNDIIELIEANAGNTTREERIREVERITDAYVEQTGTMPDGKALARMSDVLLHEELTDPRPDKMTIEEYPILSDRMYAVRTKGKERKKNKSGVTTLEVPLEHGQNVATDGKDYTLPIRSFHNPW